MSASDLAPLPRLGEVFFDSRGETRTMRVSWYAEAGIVVISIWLEDTCTGAFRLPAADVPRLLEVLNAGLPGGHDANADAATTGRQRAGGRRRHDAERHDSVTGAGRPAPTEPDLPEVPREFAPANGDVPAPAAQSSEPPQAGEPAQASEPPPRRPERAHSPQPARQPEPAAAPPPPLPPESPESTQRQRPPWELVDSVAEWEPADSVARWEPAGSMPAAEQSGSVPRWEPAESESAASAPPWEPTESTPVGQQAGSVPPWEPAESTPVAEQSRSAPPWESAEGMPVSHSSGSAPPWEPAESVPVRHAPEGPASWEPAPSGVAPAHTGHADATGMYRAAAFERLKEPRETVNGGRSGWNGSPVPPVPPARLPGDEADDRNRNGVADLPGPAVPQQAAGVPGGWGGLESAQRSVQPPGCRDDSPEDRPHSVEEIGKTVSHDLREGPAAAAGNGAPVTDVPVGLANGQRSAEPPDNDGDGPDAASFPYAAPPAPWLLRERGLHPGAR